MTTVSISGFSGISPRTGPTLLAQNQAQQASNIKLQSGECRPWQNPIKVYTPVQSAIVSIYKLLGPAGATQWLEFTTDTDIVSAPLADTTDYRVYYTSSGFSPRKTNWALATSGVTGAYPRAYYNMGVPTPAAAPTLSASGGSAPTEVRAYVYTYLSTFGSLTEESAPSPAQLVTCNTSGATVTISGWSTAPTTAANYNITGIRIYRTVTGASTVTYQYVDQISVTPATGAVVSGSTSTGGVVLSGTTYGDTYTVAQLGTAIVSTNYTPPPSALQGLVAMPNGMLAGFTSNQVWFCEPYLPHAWPTAYMQAVDAPIVGLGVYGNTLVVCTTRNPYLMTGTTPSQISVERLPMPQPCISKRSIAFDQYGVLYASPNGLVGIGAGIQDLVTTPLYTRDDWQLLQPSTMQGVVYNNLYIGFYVSQSGTRSSIVMARNDTPTLVTFDYPANAVFVERSTGYIYAVSNVDNCIYQLDADATSSTTYQWKSKRFIQSHPVNFSALKVTADFAALALPSTSTAVAIYDAAVFAATLSPLTSNGGDMNGGLQSGLITNTDPFFNSPPLPYGTINTYMVNGSALDPTPANSDVHFVAVQVYADSVLVFSTGITSNEPIRMPANTKAYAWEVLISGTAPCRQFSMATSISELRGLAAAQALQTVNA